MSEQELREGLRAAVAEEPPLAFDPDNLMARAQRETKRRRALFGAGLATVAVAVAAVAVPTILGAPRGGGASAGSPGGVVAGCANETASAPVPSPGMAPDLTITAIVGVPGSYPVPVPETGSVEPTPSPTRPPEPNGTPLPEPSSPPCRSLSEPPGSPVPPPAAGSPSPTGPPANVEWPPPGMEAKQYTAAQLKQRGTEMRAHLRSQFPKVVQGATKITVQEFGGEASGAVSDGQSYLDTFVAYTREGMRSAVGISVFAPGAGMSPAEQCAEGGGDCKVQDGPNGTRLVITTVQVGGGGQASILSVAAYRANGTVARASGYNYDPIGEQGLKPLPDMPVTLEQLVALATDPKLAL